MARLKYLNGPVFMLKLSVLYPIDKENAMLKKILYYVWSFLYILSFVTVMIQCVVYVYLTPFNLIEEAMIIMNIVFHASLFINFFLFFYNSTSLVKLFTDINNSFVYETDNEMELLTMQQALQMSDKMAYLWTINLVFVSLAPTLMALASGKMVMPLPAWFPYDYKKSPQFEISFLWQLYCGVNLAIIYGATDMIYPCITVVMGQQFKILASNFQNNFYKALLKFGVSKKVVVEFSLNYRNGNLLDLLEHYSEIFAALNEKKFRKININYMKKNIKHHRTLLRFCDEVTRTMGMFLMVKVGGQFFNIIFAAFSLITAGNEAMFLGLCTYVCCGSCEMLLYNYSGEIWTQKADLLWNLYDSPWYLCDLTYQKMLRLVQMRTNQTVCTKAGYYFSLSARTFLTFMRTIFSYVTILNELTHREKDND